MLGAVLVDFTPGGALGQAPSNGTRRHGTRTESRLREMDANRNGIIEPNEVNAEQKEYLGQISERYGVQANLPLEIDKYRLAMDAYYARQDGSNSGGSRPSYGSSAPPAASPSSSVSSFASSGGSATSSSSGSFGSSGSSGAGVSQAVLNQIDERIRGYATGLMKRYDKNGNGILDQDEVSQMRGDWKSTDANGDGRLTVEELMTRFASYRARYVSRAGDSTTPTSSSSTSSSYYSRPSYSGSSGSPTPTGASYSSASTPAASTSAAGQPPSATGTEPRRPYRFLTATERLPAGLPEWFARKDANGDGQVSLAEYSDSLSDAVAADFARYDLNNDGMITAQECLAALRLGR